jgi:hypothetical protein
MSTRNPPARYHHAIGVSHEVIVRRGPLGAWQVLDQTDRRTRVADTLTGHDDGQPQAMAVARDYAARRSNQGRHDDAGALAA